MINKKQKISWPLVAVLAVFPSILFSQSNSVQTSVDKKDILIGEQLKLKVRTFYPLNSGAIAYSLLIPDSIPHFDLIENGKPDTIAFKDNSKAVEQTITFTSFDSGRWAIPSFRINIDTTNFLFTDSIPINVSYSPPDSTNQLRDIKPVIEVSVDSYLWYYIAGGVFLLLIATFFIIRYLKKRKEEPAAVFTSRFSPYEEAMQELEKLKQYDLHKPADIKLYHIRLCDIFKRYLGRRQNKNLLNSTTGDLLIRLTENNFPQENISVLASALRCCDAVKFAKYLPLPPESEDCLAKIKETINLMEPSEGSFGQTPSDRVIRAGTNHKP